VISDELALQVQSSSRVDAQHPRYLSHHRLAIITMMWRRWSMLDITVPNFHGSDVRPWFTRQIMLPEWMVNAPPYLTLNWSVTPSLF
jgi:hypothetical protein